MIKKVFILIMILFYVIPDFAMALEFSVEDKRKAMMEVADAYYRQGVQLQYDSYRKILNASPEDATSQHYVYTVCSGIAFQVYYQTFGIFIPDTTDEMIDFASDNLGSRYVLDYYSNTDILGSSDDSKYLDLFNKWLEVVEPGDILIRTGHAMMIERVDREKGEITYIEY